MCIRDRLKGGVFSAEINYTLAYEWKILNQGGIVDRTINGNKNPVLKLGDLDNDEDLDLLYGSQDGWNNIQVYKFVLEKTIKNIATAAAITIRPPNGSGIALNIV